MVMNNCCAVGILVYGIHTANNIVSRSDFNTFSIGSGLLAAVLLCIIREDIILLLQIPLLACTVEIEARST